MRRLLLPAFALLMTFAGACAQAPTKLYAKQEPFVARTFSAEADGRWIGQAICYGPHRDGQGPDGEQPTRAQLLEDLHILGRHWNMLRMYGARGATEIVLELIQEHDLDMQVVVGAWIETETTLDPDGRVLERFPDHVANNRAEVAAAIRLANAYPDLVAAVTVGNETQVEWTEHPVQQSVLIHYIRQVRAETNTPVSTADVSTYWSQPRSRQLAGELDFIMTHIYAKWNKQTLDTAMPWTR
ncbi:MAG: hypothetical protein AAF288_05995, partial [Planctomycetota bacterium]